VEDRCSSGKERDNLSYAARFLDTNDEAFIGKWVVRKLSGGSFAVNDIVLWGKGSQLHYHVL